MSNCWTLAQIKDTLLWRECSQKGRKSQQDTVLLAVSGIYTGTPKVEAHQLWASFSSLSLFGVSKFSFSRTSRSVSSPEKCRRRRSWRGKWSSGTAVHDGGHQHSDTAGPTGFGKEYKTRPAVELKVNKGEGQEGRSLQVPTHTNTLILRQWHAQTHTQGWSFHLTWQHTGIAEESHGSTLRACVLL